MNPHDDAEYDSHEDIAEAMALDRMAYGVQSDWDQGMVEHPEDWDDWQPQDYEEP